MNVATHLRWHANLGSEWFRLFGCKKREYGPSQRYPGFDLPLRSVAKAFSQALWRLVHDDPAVDLASNGILALHRFVQHMEIWKLLQRCGNDGHCHDLLQGNAKTQCLVIVGFLQLLTTVATPKQVCIGVCCGLHIEMARRCSKLF